MTDFSTIMSVSSSGMKAQAQRIRHVSENIANADTPGYHRKTVSFQAVMEQGATTGQVKVSKPSLDQSPLNKIYDPSNPLANAHGYYEGSNVNMLFEVTDAREAQRSYQANLKVFDQVRRMSQSLMELLQR